LLCNDSFLSWERRNRSLATVYHLYSFADDRVMPIPDIGICSRTMATCTEFRPWTFLDDKARHHPRRDRRQVYMETKSLIRPFMLSMFIWNVSGQGNGKSSKCRHKTSNEMVSRLQPD
jgi:hypothetical protein